eukprot:TRINITY_DN2540_c0_g1_i1.p1 TRINITY_DN2540_c0_g1~~TRINITY_DN2540_c0_g1_i1.p1  ORF type:complete len:815 (+),score=208.01 TRINITY_DN2540_c0_g1_i1:91-2535(+)
MTGVRLPQRERRCCRMFMRRASLYIGLCLTVGVALHSPGVDELPEEEFTGVGSVAFVGLGSDEAEEQVEADGNTEEIDFALDTGHYAEGSETSGGLNAEDFIEEEAGVESEAEEQMGADGSTEKNDLALDAGHSADGAETSGGLSSEFVIEEDASAESEDLLLETEVGDPAKELCDDGEAELAAVAAADAAEQATVEAQEEVKAANDHTDQDNEDFSAEESSHVETKDIKAVPGEKAGRALRRLASMLEGEAHDPRTTASRGLHRLAKMLQGEAGALARSVAKVESELPHQEAGEIVETTTTTTTMQPGEVVVSNGKDKQKIQQEFASKGTKAKIRPATEDAPTVQVKEKNATRVRRKGYPCNGKEAEGGLWDDMGARCKKWKEGPNATWCFVDESVPNRIEAPLYPGMYILTECDKGKVAEEVARTVKMTLNLPTKKPVPCIKKKKKVSLKKSPKAMASASLVHHGSASTTAPSTVTKKGPATTVVPYVFWPPGTTTSSGGPGGVPGGAPAGGGPGGASAPSSMKVAPPPRNATKPKSSAVKAPAAAPHKVSPAAGTSPPKPDQHSPKMPTAAPPAFGTTIPPKPAGGQLPKASPAEPLFVAKSKDKPPHAAAPVTVAPTPKDQPPHAAAPVAVAPTPKDQPPHAAAPVAVAPTPKGKPPNAATPTAASPTPKGKPPNAATPAGCSPTPKADLGKLSESLMKQAEAYQAKATRLYEKAHEIEEYKRMNEEKEHSAHLARQREKLEEAIAIEERKVESLKSAAAKEDKVAKSMEQQAQAAEAERLKLLKQATGVANSLSEAKRAACAAEKTAKR